MPKAGQVERIVFKRRNSAGAGVAGKVLADFSFPAYLDGDVVVLTVSDFEDLTGGDYAVSLAMPTTLGRIRIDPVCSNPTTDTLDPDVLEGRITANNIDDVAVLAARPPSVTLAGNVSPQSAFTITAYKGDGKTFQVPIYDDNGTLRNLALWENFRFSIKNADQTVVSGQLPYDLAAGITGSAGGILSIPVPEDCSAYLAHPAGHKKTTLYWSVDANLISAGNTKTITLRAGPFVILSKETPTP